MDDYKGDLSEAYYIGQSVRSTILDVSELLFNTAIFELELIKHISNCISELFSQVNSETGRITLSLKQSSCSSTDASFIQEYFVSEDKVNFYGRVLF